VEPASSEGLASTATLPPEPLPLLLPLGPPLLLPLPELLPVGPESVVVPPLPPSGAPALPARTHVPPAHVCEQQSPKEAHDRPLALHATPLHVPATQS
jgi:hypothetical protein